MVRSVIAKHLNIHNMDINVLVLGDSLSVGLTRERDSHGNTLEEYHSLPCTLTLTPGKSINSPPSQELAFLLDKVL